MALKKQYQVFVNEMIKHGDQVAAYKTAYPKASDEAARVNSYKILQNATISAAIKESADKIRSVAESEAIQELKEEIKGNMLTAFQKREILYKIAFGEMTIPIKKPYYNSDTQLTEVETVDQEPDFYERMKAIEIDNKMTGDNAPDKTNFGMDDALTALLLKVNGKRKANAGN